MLQLHAQPQNNNQHPLYCSLARTPSEVAEAQRLRYKVFAEEMGAQLSGTGGLDQDGFDDLCDHLLVRESGSNQVVGTYRILSPQKAFEAGGYYSAGGFDLTRLGNIMHSTAEIGRACVHKNYRSGGTITLLWAGLAKYMQMHNIEHVIGSASIPMQDGGHAAASLYHKLKDEYAAPAEYRVFPHKPLPIDALNQGVQAACPPLLKGYLRLGAYICGAPAWDAYFNTADLLILLPISRLNTRYAAHFFK